MRHQTIFLIVVSLLKLFGCSGQEQKSMLTPGMLSGVKDDRLEQVVFDDISAMIETDRRGERDILKSLTPGQRAIYVTSIIEGEVNNGGFNQFYFNSSGQLADMGEESFKTIGATKFAELMRQANATFSEIKDDLEKFNDGTIESFSKSYENNPLNDLDDKFYELDSIEPLRQIKVEFIRKNVKEFVSE
jgi:hypothetical protein